MHKKPNEEQEVDLKRNKTQALKLSPQNQE